MILITGVTSGLGKYLLETTENAEGWKRGMPLPMKYYDSIIHCAHDRNDPHANLEMLQMLQSVPCGRFVYISSIDVHKAFSLDNFAYAQTKLRCEQFVRSSFPDHLIVRPCAMMGEHMRENTLLRMLEGRRLTVTPDSTFAFVQHSTVARWLKMHGTTTVSGNVMTVKDIAEEFGLSPEYGDFPYYTPPVKPTHDTLEEIKAFKQERK